MDQFQAQLASRLIDIAGNIISAQIAKPDFKAQEKMIDDHYDRLKKIVAREEGEPALQKQMENEQEYLKEKGTACLPCSKSHFSTASASLNEAVRFARTDGLRNPEVVRRVGIALDELNICERIDLAPDMVVTLPDIERPIAEWAIIQSRELRHMIDEITTIEQLERVAAKASDLRTEIMTKMFELTKEIEPEVLINKICVNLPEDEQAKCEQAIREVLASKKEDVKKMIEAEKIV